MLERYASESQTDNAIIIQTQIPGMVDGWARTFTVRTEIKDNSSQTCAFKHERVGVYNPSTDIYFIAGAPISHSRHAALVQHYELIDRIQEKYGFHPTESFERHCRVHGYQDNNL